MKDAPGQTRKSNLQSKGSISKVPGRSWAYLQSRLGKGPGAKTWAKIQLLCQGTEAYRETFHSSHTGFSHTPAGSKATQLQADKPLRVQKESLVEHSGHSEHSAESHVRHLCSWDPRKHWSLYTHHHWAPSWATSATLSDLHSGATLPGHQNASKKAAASDSQSIVVLLHSQAWFAYMAQTSHGVCLLTGLTVLLRGPLWK